MIGMVTVGIDVASSRAAVDLAGRFSTVHAAVAVHPHEAGRARPKATADLRPLAAHPNVLAGGGTGRGYAKRYAPAEVQRRGAPARLVLQAAWPPQLARRHAC